MSDNFTKEFVDGEIEFIDELRRKGLESVGVDIKLIDLITESLCGHKGETKWRIRFNGSTVTTNSGKTFWRLKSHARSALIQHFMSFTNHSPIKLHITKLGGFGEHSHTEYAEFVKKKISDLEKLGIVEYVEVKYEIVNDDS